VRCTWLIGISGLRRSCEYTRSTVCGCGNGAGVLTDYGRLIVIPLSFLRRLDSLKYTSVIALISIAYLVVLVVYHFASGDTLSERGTVNIIKWQGILPTLGSFPIIVFAYTCHQNVRIPPYYIDSSRTDTISTT